MLVGKKTEFGYLTEVSVRWSDMDSYQHINHARMITLLEEARLPWLFYDQVPTAALKNGCVVVDLNCKYKTQLRYVDSPLQVNMWIQQVRSVDFIVNYEVRAKTAELTDKPAVVAQTHLAVFDVEKQKLRRLTTSEKNYLLDFVK